MLVALLMTKLNRFVLASKLDSLLILKNNRTIALASLRETFS